MTGCASTLDKHDIEQTSNPVKDMHKALTGPAEPATTSQPTAAPKAVEPKAAATTTTAPTVVAATNAVPPAETTPVKPASDAKDAVASEKKDKPVLEWTGYEESFAKARKENKFIMIDFYADWCIWCKRLDSITYVDPAVIKALKDNFITVKVDTESDKKVAHEMRLVKTRELKQIYGVNGMPTIWFINPDGTRAKMSEGFMPPDTFLEYLDYITSGKYKAMEFEQYLTTIGKRSN